MPGRPRRVVGNQNLTESQAYTQEFGYAVEESWEDAAMENMPMDAEEISDDEYNRRVGDWDWESDAQLMALAEFVGVDNSHPQF